jgi:hypothetical protein
MEATPATSNAPGMTGTDGEKGRTLAGKRPSATGPRSGQVSAHTETDAQEDWSLATADPAFWLKEID